MLQASRIRMPALGGALAMQGALCGGAFAATSIHRRPGARNILDLTARVQDLCGLGAQSRDVFCSNSSFGRHNLGHKPISRVTYRCGAGYVRAVEARREEPIMMRCPLRHDDQAPAASPIN